MANILKGILELVRERYSAISAGLAKSFNNGSGRQSFHDATINSGAYSGKGNGSRKQKNYGVNVINNNGDIQGIGNGSIFYGKFNCSKSG